MVTETEKLAVLCQQLQMGAKTPAQGKTATFQKVTARTATGGDPSTNEHQRAPSGSADHTADFLFIFFSCTHPEVQNRSAAAAGTPQKASGVRSFNPLSLFFLQVDVCIQTTRNILAVVVSLLPFCNKLNRKVAAAVAFTQTLRPSGHTFAV